eukprot:gene18185-813_t
MKHLKFTKWTWTLVINIVNYTASWIFLIECILKLIAIGPKSYLSERWNVLDFVLVLISIPDLPDPSGGGSSFSAFRALRIFRIFRMLRFSVDLQKSSYIPVLRCSPIFYHRECSSSPLRQDRKEERRPGGKGTGKKEM